jgi:hypothetical protein
MKEINVFLNLPQEPLDDFALSLYCISLPPQKKKILKLQ